MSCLSTNKAVGMHHCHAKFHKEAPDMLLDQFIVKIICFQKNLNLLSWNHDLKKVWALRFISATSGWCYWEINTLPISNTLPSSQKEWPALQICTSNRFCFNRHGRENAYWHDFERPSEGIWHPKPQNLVFDIY